MPLAVDLDGTLVRTDTLAESALILIKRNPFYLFSFFFWLFKGLPFFKMQLTSRSQPDFDLLPWNEEVIDFLRNEKARGREIILATASDQSTADIVAAKFDFFSKALGTSNGNNLRGANKKDALIKLYGEKNFDYIGDSKRDLPVWAASRQALIVEPSKSLLEKARKCSEIGHIFGGGKSKFKLFVKEIRVYQWVKNILLALPLLMAHKLGEAGLFFDVFLAFLAFSLTASSVYVTNDLLDLNSDRQHPRKRNRPLASGALPLQTAFVLIPFLLISGFALSLLFLPPVFTLCLTLYIVLTTAYSFILKKIYIVDIIILAGLYTLRIIAGALAVDVYISPWLVEFSMFLFLSLAIVKRYTELNIALNENRTSAKGRGYLTDDISLMRTIGPASGYLAALVFALYVNSAEVVKLYPRHQLLWAVTPLLLYWLTRIWFLAHRGKMHDDPIVFTGKDPVSYIIGGIIIILVIGAAL